MSSFTDAPPSAAAQQKLFESAALIIRLAEDKGVDPYEWLTEEDGIKPSTELSLSEFASRLTSLAFGVTVHCGGRKTMLEVERGLSEKALVVIAKTCGGRHGATINVASFLAKCSEIAHPGGGTAASSSSSSSSSRSRSSSPVKSSTTLLPASPYDEEILFASVEAEEEEDEAIEPPRSQTQRKSLAARIGTPLFFPLKEKPKEEAEKEPPKTGPASAPASTAYNLRDPADLVEDVLRKLTRQPNDYFRLQVHLGWHAPTLRDSTARGVLAIAALGKKAGAHDWLTTAVLKMALLEGRAPLSEAQIGALFFLVRGFAATHRKTPSLSPSLSSSLPAGPLHAKKQSVQTLRAKKVVFKGRLNAQWLRLYLEHLRLHNRTSSALSEKITTTTTTTTTTTNNSKINTTVADETSTDIFTFTEEEPPLPKELQRALQGRPHSLSADELRKLLNHHPLLTEAQLQAEVGHRVRCWTGDLSGHNEFERSVRLALSQASKTAAATHRQQLEAVTRDRLSREKAEELLSSERLDSAISRSLFGKFDSFCRASNYADACSWKEWIEWHQSPDEVAQRELDVRRIQRVASLRLAESAEKRQSQPPPSPFYWHESSYLTEAGSPPRDNASRNIKSPTRYFRSVQPASLPSKAELSLPPKSPSLGTRHGTELRNSLAFARCNLMTAGVGLDASIVGLDDLLAPLDVGLPPDSPRPETKKECKSNSNSNSKAISSVFSFATTTADDGAGEEGADDPATTARKAQAKNFKRWRARKAQQLREKKQKELDEAEAKKAHEDRKSEEARRQYKSWCRLRDAGRYKSYTGTAGGVTCKKKAVKMVPRVTLASHELCWAGRPKTVKTTKTSKTVSSRDTSHEESFSMSLAEKEYNRKIDLMNCIFAAEARKCGVEPPRVDYPPFGVELEW